MTERATVRVECVLPHSPARVWSALTDQEKLAQWFVPHDLKLIVGHKYTFTVQMMPDIEFDGVFHCEVLDFTPERRLHLSWVNYSGYGLVSTVTWLLEPVEGGTHLVLEHSGYDLNNPFQTQGYTIMQGGWSQIGSTLGAFLDAEPVQRTA